MNKFFLILFVPVLFCCNATQDAAENKTVKPLFTILYSSQYQGREMESTLVVSNQSDLVTLFLSLGKSEIPAVDFKKSQVVALFLGTRNTGGFQISVASVAEENGKVIVYKKTEKSDSKMVTMALTNPFVVAEIYSTKEIIFKE
jgi:hypothetical protein